jgi:hypothetical protein
MTRLALAAPIALLAAALAAGCSSPPKTPAAAQIKPVQQPYMAGTGVVQAVKPAPAPMATAQAPSESKPAPGASAPAGAKPAPAPTSGMQRLSIRMDNGRMVWVDTPSTEFQPGTRVQLTEANEIRRL